MGAYCPAQLCLMLTLLDLLSMATCQSSVAFYDMLVMPEGSGEEGSGEDQPSFSIPDIPEDLSSSSSRPIPQIEQLEESSTSSISNIDIQPSNSKCRSKDVDIVFALDASGSLESIYAKHINWTLHLTESLFAHANPSSLRVALVQYAERPRTEIRLNEGDQVQRIVERLGSLSNIVPGRTDTGRALKAVEIELYNERHGARRNAAKIIVLYTDGLSEDDPVRYAETLREKRGAKIFVVSVGSDGFESEMLRIAGDDQNVFKSNEFTRLQRTLIDEICNEPRPNQIQSHTALEPIVTERVQQIADKYKSMKSLDSLENGRGTSDLLFPVLAQHDQASKQIDQATTQIVDGKAIINTDQTTQQTNGLTSQNEQTIGQPDVTSDLTDWTKNWTIGGIAEQTYDGTTERIDESTTEQITDITFWQTSNSTSEQASLGASEQTEQTSTRTDETPTQTEETPTQTGETATTKTADETPTQTDTTLTQTVSESRLNEQQQQELAQKLSSSHTTEWATTDQTQEVSASEPLSVSEPLVSQQIVFSKNQVKKQPHKLFKTQKQTTTDSISSKTPPQRAVNTSARSTTTTTTTTSTATRSLEIKSGPHCPQDILFIVDSSGSVQQIYDQQKEFLKTVIGEMQMGEDEQRVALVQFAGSSHQRVEWTFDTIKDAKQVNKAFERIRHITGTTFIGRALTKSLSILDSRRKDVPTTVVLVSDGFSQDDATKPAEDIRSQPNVVLYALSISELNNTYYLVKITDDPTKVYIGPRSEELKQIMIKSLHCQS